MNELDALVRKHSEMIYEFSSLCIGRIEGHGPLKVLPAPLRNICVYEGGEKNGSPRLYYAHYS